MKAEELMIGDYFFVAKDNLCIRKGSVVEIRGINADDRLESKNLIGSAHCRPLDKDQFEGGIWLDYLEPIPLTPEILVENGFKDVDIIVVGTRKFRWQSEDGRTEITIWLDDTMPMDIVKNVYYEDEVSYSLPFPWAVHTLQHALRLCGIDKEITV